MSFAATSSARACPVRVFGSREASPSTTRPTRRVVSWGLENGGRHPKSRRRSSRMVMRASSEDTTPEEPTEGGIPLRNLRRDTSAQEYVDLKKSLFKNTGLYAAGLVAYSTLGYGLGNGISAAIGGVSSLVYLNLLCEHVDKLSSKETDDPDDLMYTRNLVYEPVTDVGAMLGGAFGKVGSVYSQALFQKRLLVPVAVAAATRCGAFPWFPHSADKYITTGLFYRSCAFNKADLPFDVNYGPLFLGFLTYKAAVLTKLYQDLKPDIVAAIAGNPEGEEE